MCGNVSFVARLGSDPAVQSGQGGSDSLLGQKVQLLSPLPGPERLLPGAFSASAVLAGRAALHPEAEDAGVPECVLSHKMLKLMRNQNK